MTGRYEESWALAEGAPDMPDPLTGKAILLYHLGQPDEAEAVRRKLEQMDPPNSSFHMAKIYANWGNFDRAFEQLSNEDISSIPVSFIKYDPHLAPLRDDPRWDTTLRRFPDPYEILKDG